MQKKIANIFCVVVSILFSAASYSKSSLTSLQTVDCFYRQLLSHNYRNTPNVQRPSLKFSTSFKLAIEKNSEICRNYATGVCGWAADSDEYLNAQESDPLLNYKNSKIKLRELEKNIIEVKLNVYPSETKEIEYYNRTIIFLMIKEGEDWVADDILYGEANSSRKYMEIENSEYIAHPDPDSKMAKK